MDSQHRDTGRVGPDSYEIRLQGTLPARWASWFDQMTVETEPGGVTLLRGPVADQAELHGILDRLRDLGLPLVSLAVSKADAR